MVGEVKRRELLSEPANVFVNTGNAAVVLGKLFLPIARKEGKVARNKRISISLGITFGTDETIAVVLEVRLEI